MDKLRKQNVMEFVERKTELSISYTFPTVGEVKLEEGGVIAIMLERYNQSSEWEVGEWFTGDTPLETVQNFGTQFERAIVLDSPNLTDKELKVIAALNHERSLYADCFALDWGIPEGEKK